MKAEENTIGKGTDGAVSIKVRLLFFGAAREIVGTQKLDFATTSRTAAALKAEIINHFPELARFNRSLLMAVNETYAEDDALVSEQDEIAFFPPVSGGNIEAFAPEEASYAADFYELTTKPIDINAVARRIVPPNCGATVTLDGYVREHTQGKQRTLYLVYEAYEPMARRELARIIRQAHTEFNIAHVGIVHRIGRLEIGETSVVVSVAAPHRQAAFEACEWLIKELKRTVPIWKHEFYEDGSVWVEGENTSQE